MVADLRRKGMYEEDGAKSPNDTKSGSDDKSLKSQLNLLASEPRAKSATS